ncbi:MAG TPA: ADP-ribosylglycohydrolase family protein [Myxococcota bacterium]|nr:ADP-ribosylglycohydrolase family protein [Myxococcota bacterium]HRY96045.1 ADP-ribosylglycohydrolase family protein [Myxococcota bacterium]HSA21857.1 ADP-ribosylglycohydrolase family protein [Myxococcota bacterium]
MPTELERGRGAWLGLAVGDALGAPVEFLTAEAVAARHGRLREMVAGGVWRKGEWTDDTALAIAAAHAYGQPGGPGFALEAAGQAMLRWFASEPKDVGNLTRLALGLMARGGLPAAEAGAEAARRRPGSAGNGSLMRAAPTGLVRQPGDARLAEESRALSRVTHADSRCTEACVAFNAALSALVHAGAGPRVALASAREAVAGLQPEVEAVVAGVLAGAPPLHARGSIGFVLLCLEVGLTALRDAPSFEQGLVEVVNLGGDSDTNGAVAGALLGARFGLAAIPARWLDALLGRDELEAAWARLDAARAQP